MSTFFLAGFLLLFGVMQLIETKIPGWVLGVVAVAAAIALIVNWKRTP